MLNQVTLSKRRALPETFGRHILKVFVLLLAARSAWGALATDVIVSTDRSSAGTSITSPSFSSKSANELLLAFVSADASSSGVRVTGVTGAGLTWVLVQRTNVQMGTAEIWQTFAPAVLSGGTVKATLSQSVVASMTVVSFTGTDTSGTNGSGAIGNKGSGNATAGAPTATLATTRANSWVWGVGNDWDNAIARTVGTNQTMVHQYLASVGDTYWVQRESGTTAVSGTSVTINDTAPTSDRYNLSLVEVLPAPGTMPVAVNDSYATIQGQTLTVAAPGVLSNDSSPGGLPLTAIQLTNPANGTATLNANGSFTYTPNATFSGSDSFTYKANNGTADSNTATVTITVSPVPVAVNDAYTTVQGQTLTVAAPGVLSNDSSPGGLPLTAIQVTNTANGTATLNANGSFTYTPNASFSGSDSFTYKANNGAANSNIATVTITVSAVPVAVNDSYTTIQGQALTVAAPGVLSNDSSPGGLPLTAIQLTNPANGTATLNANGGFTYTPNASFSGSDSFTYKANNGTADSNTATVTITVTTSTSCPCTIWSASTVPGTASATDGSSVEVGVKFRVNQAGYITGLRFYKGTLNTGKHIANLWSGTGTLLGTATFTNESSSGWQQVTFPTPVSLAPNTTYIASYFAPAGGYAFNYSYFTSAVTSGPLSALANGQDGGNGVYLYSAVSAFPTSTFSATNYWVDVVFTTSLSNVPPVANNDTYSVNQGQTLSVAAPGVLANDTDPNGYALTAVTVTGPSNGALVLSSNGSFTYTPNATFTGNDSFTYKANDGFLNSNSAAVTIAVTTGSNLGVWSSPVNWPLVSINSILMHTGKVLVYEDSGVSAQVWDPGTGNFAAVPNNYTNLFCSGHSALADGRILVLGGHGTDYATDIGSADVNIFDPISLQWTPASRMAYRRWYGTSTTLPDGRILATSGNDVSATSYVTTPEVYDPSKNIWTPITSANLQLPLYPHLFVLPSGQIAYTGNTEGDSYPGPLSGSRDTRTLDLSSWTWKTVVPSTIDGDSVMYAPGKIMKAGSSNDGCFNGGASVSATFVIDFNQPSPLWQQTSSMAFPRTNHNLTILPDGSVLATGGGMMKNGCDGSEPVFAAELWSPTTQTWTTMSAMATPRLYHSAALLLPDGRVLVSGGGRDQGAINELSAEIYSPPYLFKGARPSITSAPSTATYGSSFFVSTPDGAAIGSVALMRPGAATHSFNQDQRFINLSFQQTAGGITVQAPANANLAPPGYYMIFLVNQSGVPSISVFIQLQ